MFVFSTMHSYQGEEAVQQVLVFPDKDTKERFEKVLIERKLTTIKIEEVDENGIGAIYKLKAVKNISEKYSSVVRSGFTGHLLYEDYRLYDTPKEAIVAAMESLLQSIILSVNETKLNM